MRRRAFLLLGTLSLAGCGGPEPELYPPEPYSATPPPAAAPPGRASVGQVALLLPLTGPNPQLARAMLNAARLALDVPGAPGLDVRDTGGAPAGARRSAEQAIAAGDRIMLGPLTAAETASVADPAAAAGVPVLAFTSDPAQARPGVWTLGLTPGQQVRRLVAAAAAKGMTRFAALLPDNDLGLLMAAALAEAAQATGAPPIVRHYAEAPAAIDEQARELGAGSVEPGARSAPPFDALLLAAAGPRLTELASALARAEIDPVRVQILGPALWAQPAARAGGGKLLDGAWYAAPDPAARAPFESRYRAKYGAAPPSLADLAYDAAAIARVVHRRGGWPLAVLTRPDGFAGVDGLVALLPDGHARRGLALFEIRAGEPKLLEPPPRSLGPGA